MGTLRREAELAHLLHAIYLFMAISREMPLFLTIPSAARRIGIDPRRLKAAIENEQIPAIVIGRQTMVSRLVIERLAQGDNCEL